MVVDAHRQLMDWAGRLLRRPSAVVEFPVHDGVVQCPRNGTVEGLDRCMLCDGLVMLEADADGEGRVECRPGVTVDASSAASP